MKTNTSIMQLATCSAAILTTACEAFAPSHEVSRATSSSALHVSGGPKKSPTGQSLTPLPRGISPFEKSLSKSIDIQAEFRNTAKRAIDAAIADGEKKIEIEFPPVRAPTPECCCTHVQPNLAILMLKTRCQYYLNTAFGWKSKQVSIR